MGVKAAVSMRQLPLLTGTFSYTAPLTSTVRVSPCASVAVPVMTGFDRAVTCETTVGTSGAVVSMVSSCVLMSLVLLPATSVVVAVTL